MTVLILEASTSAAKAMCYDPARGVLSQTVRPYAGAPLGLGEQDCDGVVRAVLDAGREAANGRQADAVAIVGTWHSIAVLDGDMTPVTPTYSWEYTASDETARAFREDPEAAADLYHRTGCVPHCTYAAYTLLHQQKRGLDLQGKRMASQSGYLFYRLTGVFAESPCTMSGGSLINLETRGYDERMLDLLGAKPEQFGALRTYRQTCPLSAEAARLLGQRAGIPVVPGHADGAMNQVGAGGTKSGVMTLSVGTSAAMRVTIPRPKTSDAPGLWCYVGADGWITGAAIAGACNCVTWLKSTVLRGALSYAELEKTPCGEPPLFLPFLFGERCPGWHAQMRGGFSALSADTDAAALYYAVQEGVCFNLRQCYELFRRSHSAPDRILLSGGILHSDRWTHMLADILGQPLEVSPCEQASLLGGAALALCAAGALESPAAFEVEPGAVCPCDEAAAQRYEPRYRAYLRQYDGAL